MNSPRLFAMTRWVVAFGALAGIVTIYRRWLHVNPTTVALTLLLYILLLAARWSLRYAVAVSIAATALYNFYFLPPIRTFTIADPQNWLALFAFLATSVIGSRLSQKARDETEEARRRQHEVEALFALSRDLLQSDTVATLVNAMPEFISTSTRAESVTLYLLEGDRLYQTGLQRVSGVEIPHFRQLALTLAEPETTTDAETRIPLRAGVRPRGLLLLREVRLSRESFQAIGGLVSIALDRAQALEDVARSEANKEGERLRTLILDSITHELRTPLTSIKGAASTLLSTQGIGESDRRELLTIVDEEADRLNRLVGEAVEMAQLEAQEVHMNFAPVSVADIVKQAQQSCAWASPTHPVSIELAPLPKVSADPEMVVKVLCNLLDNAAKYSNPNSPIFVSAEQKDGFIFISVADRGVGIDPIEQSLIFDRLYRSRIQNGSTSGTGMGLAISRAIIESHHGSITVTSQPEHGSVFTFSLPIAP
ncbi:MAG: ATP-binding protein [Acidobacteriaceae bacterium]